MKKSLTMSARNKAFWKKKPATQRILIAKDVLKQIQLGFIIPQSGTYFTISDLDTDIKKPSEKLDIAFEQLKEQKASCEVCGIGSCFVSLVNLGNNAETKDFFIGNKIGDYSLIKDHNMRPLLRKVFAPEQLSMIESAFEESDSFTDREDCSENDKHLLRAEKFGAKYANDKNRLIGIMNNIIKHKGEFIP